MRKITIFILLTAFLMLFAGALAGGAGRTTCLLLELTEGEDGIYNAEPVLGKSGLMTTLTRADGYTLIHGDKEGLKEGELIQVTLF